MGRDRRKTRQSRGVGQGRPGGVTISQLRHKCNVFILQQLRGGLGIPAAQQPWPHPFSSPTLSNAISSPGLFHPLSEPTLEELRLGTKRTETEGTQRVRTTQVHLHPVKSSWTILYCQAPCGQNCISYRVNSRRDRMCTHTHTIKSEDQSKISRERRAGVEKRKLGR